MRASEWRKLPAGPAACRSIADMSVVHWRMLHTSSGGRITRAQLKQKIEHQLVALRHVCRSLDLDFDQLSRNSMAAFTAQEQDSQ